MANSEHSQTTSKNEPVQLPLKGFHVEVKSDHPDWRKLIEGMGNGRIRIHLSKIKK